MKPSTVWLFAALLFFCSCRSDDTTDKGLFGAWEGDVSQVSGDDVINGHALMVLGSGHDFIQQFDFTINGRRASYTRSGTWEAQATYFIFNVEKNSVPELAPPGTTVSAKILELTENSLVLNDGVMRTTYAKTEEGR